MVLVRTLFEGTLEQPEEVAELVLADADDDRAAGVRPALAGPAPSKHGEVPDVERDDDPPLVRAKRKDGLIVDAAKCGLLCDRPHVVAPLPKHRGERPGREVLVEE